MCSEFNRAFFQLAAASGIEADESSETKPTAALRENRESGYSL